MQAAITMHTAISNPQMWGRWRGAKRLALLAAFEDSVTGTRVKEFRRELSRQLGQGCEIVEHVWVLSMFRFHELQAIAAEEAATADLVVIAVHDEQGVPDELRSWMDLWLHQGARQNAVLLALLDSASDETPWPMEAYLQEAARRGGLEFVMEMRAGPE